MAQNPRGLNDDEMARQLMAYNASQFQQPPPHAYSYSYADPPQPRASIPQGYEHAQSQTDFPYTNEYGYSTHQSSVTYQSHAMHQNLVANADEAIEEEARSFATAQDEKRAARRRATSGARKQGQNSSKRSNKRKFIRELGYTVGSNDRPQGLTRYHPESGQLEWYDPEDNIYRSAAFHSKYRQQFLGEDGGPDHYDQPPERGLDPDDLTSACSAFNQLHWNLRDRSSFGNVVDHEQHSVLYLLEKPEYRSRPAEPRRLWFHDGFVLIDGDKNNVRDFGRQIPRVFSSKFEGGRIEALRRILPSMDYTDFRARCPTTIVTPGGSKELYGLSTFIQRCNRFRQQFQLAAWTPRAGSDVIRKAIIDQLHDKTNSTEALQAVSKYKVSQTREANRGRFLHKAAGRQITDEERAKRNAKYALKMQSLAQREAEKQAAISDAPSTQYTDWQRRYSASAEENPYSDPSYHQPPRKRARMNSPILDPQLQIQSTEYAPWSQGPSQHSNHAGNIPINASTDDSQRQNVSKTQDLRRVAPRTLSEQLSVKGAMWFTLAHYRTLVSDSLPPISPDLSFAAQYKLVTEHLTSVYPSGEPPRLAHIPPWYDFGVIPLPILQHDVIMRLLAPLANEHPDSAVPAALQNSKQPGTAANGPIPASSSTPESLGAEGYGEDLDNELFGAGSGDESEED